MGVMSVGYSLSGGYKSIFIFSIPKDVTSYGFHGLVLNPLLPFRHIHLRCCIPAAPGNHRNRLQKTEDISLSSMDHFTVVCLVELSWEDQFAISFAQTKIRKFVLSSSTLFFCSYTIQNRPIAIEILIIARQLCLWKVEIDFRSKWSGPTWFLLFLVSIYDNEDQTGGN